MMRKITMFLLFFCFMTTSASAHVMNRDNVYSDLSLTEAADDVVLLAALHVIQSDYKQFEPAKLLTMTQLAQWVAGYYGLADEQAALEAGFVSTLEGNATYEAVNAAYFNNTLTLQASQSGELTKEAFAQFVAAHVNNPINGQTMLAAASFTEGPTGVIEAFNTSDGANVLIVEGKAYVLGKHPSAIAASADPSVWVGQTIAESYIGPNSESDYAKASDDTALQFVVLGNERYTDVPMEAMETRTLEAALQEVEVVEAASEQQKEETGSSFTWLYMLLAVLVVALASVFFMKKRV